jgi:hypothetical protein
MSIFDCLTQERLRSQYYINEAATSLLTFVVSSFKTYKHIGVESYVNVSSASSANRSL